MSVGRELILIRERLATNLKKTMAHSNSVLDNMTTHILNNPGKSVRAAVMLWSCEAVGGKKTDALPFAMAYELGHTASLIQDDIMDKAETRRGKPSLCSEWGSHAAMLASDYLLFHMFTCLSEARKKNPISAQSFDEIVRTVGQTGIDLCSGQALDITGNQNTSLEEYLSIIDKKTASILAASAKIGAIAGGASTSQVQKLQQYGRNIGMAFQITDDALNIFGNQQQLGKPVGIDLFSTPNIITIHASKQKPCLRRILNLVNQTGGKYTEIVYPKLKKHLKSSHEYAQALSKKYLDSAKKQILDFPETRAKNNLLWLAEEILSRNK